jgi:hypothetical protein
MGPLHHEFVPDEVRAAASTVCSLSQVRESSHAARLRRRVLLALLLRRGAIRGAA